MLIFDPILIGARIEGETNFNLVIATLALAAIRCSPILCVSPNPSYKEEVTLEDINVTRAPIGPHGFFLRYEYGRDVCLAAEVSPDRTVVLIKHVVARTYTNKLWATPTVEWEHEDFGTNSYGALHVKRVIEGANKLLGAG